MRQVGEFSLAQKVMAATAAAFVLSACTSNDMRSNATPRSDTSAETSAGATHPSLSPEVKFENAKNLVYFAARNGSYQILIDTQHPASHCKHASNTLISNNEYIASGNPKAVPQLTINYDAGSRKVDFIYLFDAGPDSSPQAAKLGGSVQVFYDVGSAPNAVDQKIKPTAEHPSGQPMTTADVADAINSRTARLTAVEVWNEASNATTTASFNPDSSISYEYAQGEHVVGPSIVDPSNTDKLTEMSGLVTDTMHRLDQIWGNK